MALARLGGRLARPIGSWFEFNQPIMEFWAGAGDSLTAGGTEGLRAFETWLLDAPSLDKSSDAYRAGVYTEMAAELALAGGSMWLKSRAKRLIAEYGGSGVVRSKIHAATAARLRRQIAKALAEEAGHKVSFELHHIHPLFGHIGGQEALFPTAGLPAWLANSAWNMKPFIGNHAAHVAEHRAMVQMERWLAMGVSKWKTGARTSVAGVDRAADWFADADF